MQRSGTATPKSVVNVREGGPSTTSYQRLSLQGRSSSRGIQQQTSSINTAIKKIAHTGRRTSHRGSVRTDTTTGQRLQNTYRLAPENNQRFNAGIVTKLVNAILTSELEGEIYDAVNCSQLAMALADKIRARVRDMKYPRYRIVCNVTIGQRTNQTFRLASRCLWSPETDRMASASYSNGSLFAVAIVHGVYME